MVISGDGTTFAANGIATAVPSPPVAPRVSLRGEEAPGTALRRPSSPHPQRLRGYLREGVPPKTVGKG